ncbi:MAG: sulfite exporter TauE/SafE family protein [Pseudobacteriovorax sp.]|nr:sulfite exporter TauE/SafE family protein [Pseudobacteriovorax sp.]
MHHHTHGPSADAMLSAVDPLTLIGFGAVFTFSFASSLHCGFMCSPLVCSLLKERAAPSSLGIWLYNSGRLLSYLLAGITLGFLGSKLQGAIPFVGSYLSKGIGLLLVAMALLKLWQRVIPSAPTDSAFSPKSQWQVTLFALVRSFPPSLRDFMLGLITVILPCMTVTPVLTLAAASKGPAEGGLLLLAFCMGTLPIMLGATYVPLIFKRIIPPTAGAWLVTIFLFLAGIITIIR